MDDADTAAALIETARTTALSRHQQRIKTAAALPSALLCTTCGERIPDARRAAVLGTQFCIHCARHLERGEHHHTERQNKSYKKIRFLP